MLHCRLLLKAIYAGPCPSDSEWTCRESNPVHRTCALALARFDTNPTPMPTKQISIATKRTAEICFYDTACSCTPDPVQFRHLSRPSR